MSKKPNFIQSTFIEALVVKSGVNPSSNPQLKIYTFGGLRLLRAGEPVAGLGLRKAEALLVYLAFTNRPQPREVLADFLWDEFSQSRAMRNLRVVLSNLRKHLGDHLIITRETAAVDPESDLWLDAAELENALTAVREQEDKAGTLNPYAAEKLEGALALYHGEFLEGFFVREARGFDEWFSVERERLHRLVLDGMGKLVAWNLAHREFMTGIQFATRWLHLDPLMETAHRQMMLLLAYSEQQTAALQQYEKCARLLDEELGLPPSEETTAIYEAIKEGRLAPPEVMSVATTLAPAPGDPPFKGLQFFDIRDADLFFGREGLTTKLVSRLRKQRFLAVVGASGSGKSSLVRAGLVPALMAEEPLADGTRPPPGSSRWPVHILTPTAHPLEALAASLTREVESVTATATLIDDLADDPRSLHLYARKLLSQGGGERLLLLVDQFEELFTLCRDEHERRAFVNNLIKAAAEEKDGPTIVVLTLRADFYAHCAQYDELRSLLETHQVYIGQMNPEELRRTIEGPVDKGGWDLEPGLAKLLLRDIGAHGDGQPEPGALPLLSHALLETWQRRRGHTLTFAGYADSGGVRGAIAQTAERVYHQRLTAEEQALARNIFLRLTELGEGTQDTRRRVRLEELIPSPEDGPAVEAVLNTLANARLVTTEEGTAEVAHEALIREWPQLRDWLDENREGLRLHRHLTEAAQEWLSLDRDPGALYRGARLVQALEWAENHNGELNPLEWEFLEASQALIQQEERERQALEQRSRRFFRSLVAVLTLATLISSGLGIFAYQRQRDAQKSAAEAQNVALIAGSQAALANNDSDTALALAWQAVALNPDSALAQAQLSEAAYAPGTVRILAGNEADVNSIALSPDDQTMFAGANDGTVILWDLATGQMLWKQKAHTLWVQDVAFSPDGRIVGATFDDRIMLWQASNGELVRQIESAQYRQEIAFDPTSQQFATMGSEEDSRLVIWDSSSGEALREFDSGSSVEDIVYVEDGSAILSASDAGALTLIDAKTGQVIYEVQADLGTSAGSLRHIEISPDGTKVIGGFTNAGLLVWDLATGELLQHFRYDGGVFSLAFHPEDGTVLIGGAGRFQTINPQTGEVLHVNFGHSGAIVDLVITSDGSRAVTTAIDKTVRLWDLQSGQIIRRFSEPNALLFEVALSPDGQTVLAGSTDGTVTLWDVETAAVIHRFVDDQPIMAVTFSPDGRKALIGAGYRLAQKIESGHIILWDVETGEEIRRLEGQPYVVYDVEFSPDGRLAVSSGNGAMAILWAVETGEEILRFEDYWVDSIWPVESYWDVEFSPAGRQIFASHASGPIIVWDVESGEEIQQLEGHIGAGATGIAFSNDGQRLISGGWDSQAILWDMQNGDILRRFNNHAGPVGQVRFSPDETLLLGGSGDGTNSLWLVETGEVIRRYGGGFVINPNFSPDGRHAVVGYHDGAVELWRIDSTLDELLTWTQNNRYVPDLTCEQRELYMVEPLCEPTEG